MDSIGFMAHPKAKKKKIKNPHHTFLFSEIRICMGLSVFVCFTFIGPFPKQFPISHPITEDSVLPPTLSFKHQIPTI